MLFLIFVIVLTFAIRSARVSVIISGLTRLFILCAYFFPHLDSSDLNSDQLIIGFDTYYLSLYLHAIFLYVFIFSTLFNFFRVTYK
jgi:hypothetical protein